MFSKKMILLMALAMTSLAHANQRVPILTEATATEPSEVGGHNSTCATDMTKDQYNRLFERAYLESHEKAVDECQKQGGHIVTCIPKLDAKKFCTLYGTIAGVEIKAQYECSN